MALEIVRPAPFLETVALIRRHVGLKPALAPLATRQIAGAVTFGFVDEVGRLLAVMGFWPLGDGAEEIFLLGRDRSEVAPRLVEIARHARLILARRMHSGIGRIVGHVRIGHEPGRRLARLAGFVLCGDGAPPGLERWVAVHDGRTGRSTLR